MSLQDMRKLVCRDQANFLEIVDLEVFVGQDETALEKYAIVSESLQ